MHPAKPSKGPPAAISYAALALGLLILIGNEVRAFVASVNLNAQSWPILTVDPDGIAPERDGRTVHTTGEITARRLAVDPQFPVPGQFLVLWRIVEMQQWKKESTRGPQNVSGLAKNGFDIRWSNTEIDTRADAAPPEQQNPPMPLRSQVFTAEGLQLGAYSLTPDVLAALGQSQRIETTRELADALATVVPGAEGVLERNWMILARDPPMRSPRRSGQAVWPVGTLRVRFEAIPAGTYSVIGRQSERSLVPFDATVGRARYMARPGAHPADAIFRQARSDNQVLTWALRLFGAGLVVAGLLGVLLHRTNVRRYGRHYAGNDWSAGDD
jgi:hypothetical protein